MRFPEVVEGALFPPEAWRLYVLQNWQGRGGSLCRQASPWLSWYRLLLWLLQNLSEHTFLRWFSSVVIKFCCYCVGLIGCVQVFPKGTSCCSLLVISLIVITEGRLRVLWGHSIQIISWKQHVPHLRLHLCLSERGTVVTILKRKL